MLKLWRAQRTDLGSGYQLEYFQAWEPGKAMTFAAALRDAMHREPVVMFSCMLGAAGESW